MFLFISSDSHVSLPLLDSLKAGDLNEAVRLTKHCSRQRSFLRFQHSRIATSEVQTDYNSKITWQDCNWLFLSAPGRLLFLLIRKIIGDIFYVVSRHVPIVTSLRLVYDYPGTGHLVTNVINDTCRQFKVVLFGVKRYYFVVQPSCARLLL